jgi:hypothetical protein
MNTETYNAIMQYEDQFITCRQTSWDWRIVVLADDKETVDAIVSIARVAGVKVKKQIIGKGEPDAEMHITIR